MSQFHISIGLFIILTVVVLPLIIEKYKIKDEIKIEKTLPIGTAQFRAFLKLVKKIVLGVIVLGLLMNTASIFSNTI